MESSLQLLCATCGKHQIVVPKKVLPSDLITCNMCGAAEPYFDLCAHHLEHTIQSIQDRLHQLVAKVDLRQND